MRAHRPFSDCTGISLSDLTCGRVCLFHFVFDRCMFNWKCVPTGRFLTAQPFRLRSNMRLEICLSVHASYNVCVVRTAWPSWGSTRFSTITSRTPTNRTALYGPLIPPPPPAASLSLPRVPLALGVCACWGPWGRLLRGPISWGKGPRGPL